MGFLNQQPNRQTLAAGGEPEVLALRKASAQEVRMEHETLLALIEANEKLEHAQEELGRTPSYAEPAINRAYGLIIHARTLIESILAKGR